jgi:hypothetical protein
MQNRRDKAAASRSLRRLLRGPVWCRG